MPRKPFTVQELEAALGEEIGRGGNWIVSCEGRDQICCEHKKMAVLIARSAARAMREDQEPAFAIRWEERKAMRVTSGKREVPSERIA